MEWISVKDGLPEYGEVVVGWHSSQLVPVVCIRSKYHACDIWQLSVACFYADGDGTLKTVSGRITHWMPLPEPPKE